MSWTNPTKSATTWANPSASSTTFTAIGKAYDLAATGLIMGALCMTYSGGQTLQQRGLDWVNQTKN